MLSFPDQSQAAKERVVEERMTGENKLHQEVAAARKRAGSEAAQQLAHYNLLSFHEDEVRFRCPCASH